MSLRGRICQWRTWYNFSKGRDKCLSLHYSLSLWDHIPVLWLWLCTACRYMECQMPTPHTYRHLPWPHCSLDWWLLCVRVSVYILACWVCGLGLGLACVRAHGTELTTKWWKEWGRVTGRVRTNSQHLQLKKKKTCMVIGIWQCLISVDLLLLVTVDQNSSCFSELFNGIHKYADRK